MLRYKFSISLIFEVFIYFLGFISLIFVTRFLGPEPLGIVSSSLAVVSLFSIISNLGFGVAHVKILSQGEDLNSCISTFFILKIFTTVLMVSIFLLLFFNDYIPGFKSGTVSGNVLLIIFISSILNSFNDVGNYSLGALLKISVGKSILLFQKFVNSSLRILVALNKKNVIWLALIELITNIFGLVSYIFTFRKVKIVKPDKNLVKKYFSFGIPALIISINAILLSNVLDKIFINSFFSAEEVGYYSASISLLIFFSFISNNLNNILLPYFSQKFNSGDFEEIKNVSSKIEKYIFFILSPVVAYVVFFSKDIVLFLMGSGMVKAGNVLQFLVINSFIFLLNRPLATKILGYGKFKFIMWVDIVNVILSLLFFLILIPVQILDIKLFGLGAVGASISLVISSLVIHIIYKLYTIKYINDAFNFINLTFFLIAILLFFITNLVRHYFSFNLLINLIVGIITGFTLYYFATRVLGLVSRQELLELKNLASIKSIGQTFKKEIREF